MTVPDDDRVPREHDDDPALQRPPEPGERDPEATPADVVEQARAARPAENGDEEIHVDVNASEWDAVEQARVVDLEDEDYR